jgi:hypothetical protein
MIPMAVGVQRRPVPRQVYTIGISIKGWKKSVYFIAIIGMDTRQYIIPRYKRIQ